MREFKHSGERICLFGGTFDPIHSAHLRIASEALDECELDRVVFVPAGVPPHKSGQRVTPYEDRLAMVEIACAPYARFEVSRLEDRPGRSFTIDTVKRFRQTMKPTNHLSFLIGADAFDEIETWHRWHELVGLVEFVVVTRPGGHYKIPPGANVRKVQGLELAVSSSDIRAKLAAGVPTPELPEKVRAFIEARGLYSSDVQPTALQQ